MQRFHDTRNDPLPMHSAYHEAESQRIDQLPQEFLARGGLIVQAVLGASPKQAAQAVGIGEKQARQLARDFHIQFKRQR